MAVTGAHKAVDNTVTGDSEGIRPGIRAIDDLHALAKAARIVRAALARQARHQRAKHDQGKQEPEKST